MQETDENEKNEVPTEGEVRAAYLEAGDDYFGVKFEMTVTIPANYGLWAKDRADAIEHAKTLLLDVLPPGVTIIEEKVKEIENLSNLDPRARRDFFGDGSF